MASLMLNLPGLSWTPNSLLPLAMTLSLANKWPKGYVTRMTKYEEKEGAFDLK
jgi:hypothetical protein